MEFFLGRVGREPGEMVPTKSDGVVGAGDAIMPARLTGSALCNSPPKLDPRHALALSPRPAPESRQARKSRNRRPRLDANALRVRADGTSGSRSQPFPRTSVPSFRKA